jgi:hypothetical protein
MDGVIESLAFFLSAVLGLEPDPSLPHVVKALPTPFLQQQQGVFTCTMARDTNPITL